MKTKDAIKHARLLSTYGLSLHEWEELKKKQKGVCAICQEEKTKTGKLKVLCVDHIHIRGFKKMSSEEKRKYIRGLCCFLCNTAIKFERSGHGRKTLNGMVKYFKKYHMKGEIE